MNQKKRFISIAIDGPSGAGKSTIAKIISREINFLYLDTGAMYRAFAYFAIRHGLDFCGGSLPQLTEILRLLNAFSLDIVYIDGEQQVIVNGENVSPYIRTPEISLAASAVSAVPEVREKLIELQRRIAARSNVVMDGRDIGSNVLKDAQIKIFLTAAPEDRAQRRFEELRQRGNETVTFEEVYQDILTRDHNDRTRAAAPLIQAEDAILVDTTGCALQDSLEKIRNVVREKLCCSGY